MRVIPKSGWAAYSTRRTASGPIRMALILYQRDDCHLCDQALEVLAQARAPELEHVWIDADPLLEAAYGLRVPVLRETSNGAELDWPFDSEAVQRFLATLD